MDCNQQKVIFCKFIQFIDNLKAEILVCWTDWIKATIDFNQQKVLYYVNHKCCDLKGKSEADQLPLSKWQNNFVD